MPETLPSAQKNNMNAEKIINGIMEIVKLAGNEIMKFYSSPSLKVRDKTLNNPVTEADLTSERILREGLSKILPSAHFLGEESYNGAFPQAELLWIVDPLDGTTNFTRKLPVFAISVGLFLNNEPFLGVIYDVCNSDYFYGWKGGGAYFNGQRIYASTYSSIKEAFVATGFPFSDYSMFDVYMAVFKELTMNVRGIRRLGSSALDIALTAQGKFDIFFEYGLKIWDIAAGIIIATEAGCLFSDFSGNTKNYTGSSVLVANKFLFNEMLTIISKYLVLHS